jgi:hypothetical protein
MNTSGYYPHENHHHPFLITLDDYDDIQNTLQCILLQENKELSDNRYHDILHNAVLILRNEWVSINENEERHLCRNVRAHRERLSGVRIFNASNEDGVRYTLGYTTDRFALQIVFAVQSDPARSPPRRTLVIQGHSLLVTS